MTIKLNNNTFFIFDLDDTLFQEIDFLRSAYRAIAEKISQVEAQKLFDEMWLKYNNRENVFEWIVSQFGNTVPDLEIHTLLKWYREHIPEIKLNREAEAFLELLYTKNIPMGLITDGRSITQRNKLKALGIETFFNDIIISEEFGTEKPHPENYNYFVRKYGVREYYFVGDNTIKDFIIPDQLGWNIICIKDSGQNIHRQQLENFPASGKIVSSFKDIQVQ